MGRYCCHGKLRRIDKDNFQAVNTEFNHTTDLGVHQSLPRKELERMCLGICVDSSPIFSILTCNATKCCTLYSLQRFRFYASLWPLAFGGIVPNNIIE